MIELHLKITGILLMALAALHIVFPKYFQWRKEFLPLSLITKQMFYVHTFFIALTLLFMGLLCITSSVEITTTVLGTRLSLGLSIFWTTRLIIQFFGYSSILWRGKKLETIIHVVFTLLWVYISTVFFIAYWAGPKFA